MIRVIVDSTCDFTLEEAKSLGIKIVPLTTNIDGKDYKDRVDLNPREFYDLLEDSVSFPKTSQPSPEDFLNSYKEYMENKDEILVISVTSALSGTCQSAILAKNISEYEDHIYVLDSQTGSFGAKIIALKALELINEGHDFTYICSYLNEFKNRVKIFAAVDTLEYLLKGGRIDKTSAFVGSILKFKPVLTVLNGRLEAIDKKRGMNKAIARILELMKEEEIDPNEKILIGYSGNNCDITSFKETIETEFHVSNIPCGYIGPVIGSHAGPNAKLVAYVIKK